MKYVKKPVIIEAVYFGADGFGEDVPDWLHQAMLEQNVRDYRTMAGMEFDVRTLEGVVMHGEPGYYLIRGERGELYPCRGDTFKVTYQPLEEEDKKKSKNVDDKLQSWMERHGGGCNNGCCDI